MNGKPIKNVAASIRQKILDKSRKEKRPFLELAQYYAMERFLYRLSLSPHIENYILKGALMLWIWQAPIFRPTKDIDLLGKTKNEEDNIAYQIRNICNVSVDPDGLLFDPNTIKTQTIKEGADYEGIRVYLICNLDTVRIKLQIDIGFGDIVYPKPRKAKIPSILDLPQGNLACYTKESVIAEKLEAMVKLGGLNSRMKDFYDVWLLVSNFNFQGKTITEAIKRTFSHRKTEMPERITAFSSSFIQSKTTQWNAFRTKLKQENIPSELGNIIFKIKEFIDPIIQKMRVRDHHRGKWIAPGPWQ